ncbi:MAG: helicase associated domain-containing protein, partial [Cloacibacillus sp.]|nr:helicase associated domain-containing protein [Cloacibacillus sp.]
EQAELVGDWSIRAEPAWSEKYEAAVRLLKTKDVLEGDKTTESARIGQWIARQRTLRKQGKLTQEQIEMLNALNTGRNGIRPQAER